MALINILPTSPINLDVGGLIGIGNTGGSGSSGSGVGGLGSIGSGLSGLGLGGLGLGGSGSSGTGTGSTGTGGTGTTGTGTTGTGSTGTGTGGTGTGGTPQTGGPDPSQPLMSATYTGTAGLGGTGPAAGTTTPLLPPPVVSFDPTIIDDGSILTLTGTASAQAGLGGVEIFEGTTDLGAATIDSATGTWSFAFDNGAGLHTDLQAVAYDTQGQQTVVPSNYNLTTGITGEAFTTSLDSYDGATGAYLGSTFYNQSGTVYVQSQYGTLPDGGSTVRYEDGTYFNGKAFSSVKASFDPGGDVTQRTTFNTDGSHFTQVSANRQVTQALGADIFQDTANSTHFVFHHGVGQETLYGFQAAGMGHDILSLPASDAGRLAQILHSAQGDGQGDVTINIGQGDTVTVMGVSVEGLKHHAADIRFHG